MQLPKKVCILAAGRGTRMGKEWGSINKALLPLKGKAAISWIIESFVLKHGEDTEFVVAVGFGEKEVRDYLSLAHARLDIEFVVVLPFEGPGSGPGASVLACESFLQTPFYLCCCDTIWLEESFEKNLGENWLGVKVLDPEESSSYCNLKIANGKVIGIHDKEAISDSVDFTSFSGLAHIHDFDIFFQGLKDSQEGGKLISQELQLSSGFLALIERKELGYVEISTWLDIGTETRYLKVLASLETSHFRKYGEFFYHLGERVIKYYQNPQIVRNRVQRGKLAPNLFPELLQERERFYSYRYFPGETLYQCHTPDLFNRLLEWLDQEVWINRNTQSESGKAQKRNGFYQSKTRDRVACFEKNFPGESARATVNGITVPRVQELLDQVNWVELENWEITFIHGDLQFDNILYNSEKDRFVLIDWRQDFSGLLESGDLYYDLSKLLLGIQLDLSEIRKGNFQIHSLGDAVEMNFPRIRSYSEYVSQVVDFVGKKKMSMPRVRLVSALSALSMASLHEPPLAQFLYHLGRSWLASSFNEISF